jgi:adenylate cyclase
MPTEIERKFLVLDDSWRAAADRGHPCRQGYIAAENGRTVRVRIVEEAAFLTIKGPACGISRAEFEYPIPPADAESLLAEHCLVPLIEKTRYLVPHAGATFEVDVFAGENDGLVVAELELPAEDTPFPRPAWLGKEVSDDRRYTNLALARHPFRSWHNGT